MKIEVLESRTLCIEKNRNTQNENDVEEIEIQVPEKYQDFNKKIVFITDDGIFWDLIENDKYILKKSITKFKTVEFYIWLTKDEQDFRSETKKITFFENQDASEEITDEEIDGVNTVIMLLENEISKVDNMNIEISKTGNVTTIVFTDKNGESHVIDVLDGEKGEKGENSPVKGLDYWTNEDIQFIEQYCADYIDLNISQVIGGAY